MLDEAADQIRSLQHGAQGRPVRFVPTDGALYESESIINETPSFEGNAETSGSSIIDLIDLDNSWASQLDQNGEVEKRELEDKIRSLTLLMERAQPNRVGEREEQEAKINQLERLIADKRAAVKGRMVDVVSEPRSMLEAPQSIEQTILLLAKESRSVKGNGVAEVQLSSLEGNISTRPMKSLAINDEVSKSRQQGDRGHLSTSDEFCSVSEYPEPEVALPGKEWGESMKPNISRRYEVYKHEQLLGGKTSFLGNEQGWEHALLIRKAFPHPVLEGASSTDFLTWYDKTYIFKKRIEAEGFLHKPNLVPYMCEFAQLLVTGHCGLDFLRQLTTDHVVEYIGYLEIEMSASSGNNENMLKALLKVEFPIHLGSMGAAALSFKENVIHIMKDHHGVDPSCHNGENSGMNKMITTNLRKALKNQAVLASKVWEKELISKGVLLKNVEQFLEAFTVYAMKFDRYNDLSHCDFYSDHSPKKAGRKHPYRKGKATADVNRAKKADSKKPKTRKHDCRNEI